MNRTRFLELVLFGSIFAGGALLLTFEADATLKYKRDTDKACTFCHTGIPRNGDEDPQLTEDGRKFRENGYKLTEEQKRRGAELGTGTLFPARVRRALGK